MGAAQSGLTVSRLKAAGRYYEHRLPLFPLGPALLPRPAGYYFVTVPWIDVDAARPSAPALHSAAPIDSEQ